MPPDSVQAATAKPRRLPWLTPLAAALAVVVWFWPGSADLLIYDREKILDGQLWRVVTGHWVHFNASHLLWNLVILVPAGVLLELRHAGVLRRTLLCAPLGIGLALLWFQPALGRYAGISGVASAVLVALAVYGLRTERRTRWVWAGVLFLFGAKLAAEALVGRPLSTGVVDQGIRSVPLAHLVGALVGGSVALASKKR